MTKDFLHTASCKYAIACSYSGGKTRSGYQEFSQPASERGEGGFSVLKGLIKSTFIKRSFFYMFFLTCRHRFITCNLRLGLPLHSAPWTKAPPPPQPAPVKMDRNRNFTKTTYKCKRRINERSFNGALLYF